MSQKIFEVEIDFGKLFRYYLQHWLLFFFSMVFSAILIFAISFFLITPMYRAGITVYVNNTQGNQAVDAITGTNLEASQQLVNTYVNIINSKTVLKDVIDKANLDCSVEDLRSIMTAKQIDDTEMFTVTVTHPDATTAAHIANAIAEVAPDRISSFVKGSSTEIIDYADTPDSPYTPNYKKNIILGVVSGVILTGVILTCRFVFDMRLKSEEDIANYLNIPALGSIPLYDENKKRRGGRFESGTDQKGGSHL